MDHPKYNLYIIKVDDNGRYAGTYLECDKEFSVGTCETRLERVKLWFKYNQTEKKVQETWFYHPNAEGEIEELITNKSRPILIYRGEGRWEYRFQDELYEVGPDDIKWGGEKT